MHAAAVALARPFRGSGMRGRTRCTAFDRAHARSGDRACVNAQARSGSDRRAPWSVGSLRDVSMTVARVSVLDRVDPEHVIAR
jgi:hypothetical protein